MQTTQFNTWVSPETKKRVAVEAARTQKFTQGDIVTAGIALLWQMFPKAEDREAFYRKACPHRVS